MNKYLQQDTPTTETLLFKTSYIWMTESICTNNPKIYRFSLQKEVRRKKKKKKVKSNTPPTTPDISKAEICSIKKKGLKEKWANTYLDYCKPFLGWDREGSGDRPRLTWPHDGRGKAWQGLGGLLPGFHASSPLLSWETGAGRMRTAP
jgi:hypothetical protein